MLPLNFKLSFHFFIVCACVMGSCGVTVRQVQSPSGVNQLISDCLNHHVASVLIFVLTEDEEKVVSADGNLEGFLRQWV